MNLASHLRTALEVLLQHRVRSGLTVMGITIGISSTVVMLALGRGVQDQIEQSFSRAGVTLLTVIPRTPPGASGSAQSYKLYWTDYEVLVAPGRIPHLLDAVPLASSMTDVLWQNRRVRVRLLGATAAHRQSAGLRLALGEFLSDEDDRSMRLVAVLGSRLASDLYTQGAYPLDTSLSVAGKRFRVIGVLAPTRTETDYQVIVPFRTMQKRLRRAESVSGSPVVDEIRIRVGDRDQVDDARRTIEEVLRPHRGVGPLDQDNFRVVTMEAGREAVQGIADSLTLFLAAIAGISLFVGGVGVTNIMLVSLGERTREIGIRYAVGATVRDITAMFLWESVILCGIGGVTGISLCAYGVVLIRALSDIPAKLSIDTVVLALAVSLTVGLLAGIYPALRARRLAPAEALRSL
ncbi:MAG: ABC transporter permease [Caldilineaceae bacterium SB0665_bin_21]|nr:ABC transporter permease [Caldilineaceae bacterium SB0665_bin_21]MYC61404.1 ABC transporter permease [Caldilineaceae bacterium SB0661_bin_34]